MSKYTIEGNINFQEELYKLLDEDSENEDELCQISGLPLKDKFITLECNHHFNYDALYREIYKQKYEFVFNSFACYYLEGGEFLDSSLQGEKNQFHFFSLFSVQK